MRTALAIIAVSASIAFIIFIAAGGASAATSPADKPLSSERSAPRVGWVLIYYIAGEPVSITGSRSVTSPAGCVETAIRILREYASTYGVAVRTPSALSYQCVPRMLD